jgi:type III restriction enzyme
MSIYNASPPLLNSPYEEPKEHWNILEHKQERLLGRRRAIYYYRPPKAPLERVRDQEAGTAILLKLVSLIRPRLSLWRTAGYPGVTSTTRELLFWWRRTERKPHLFFAQLEAAETIIFLTEASAELVPKGHDMSNISIPPDEPSHEKKEAGLSGFLRYACQMATGTGKSTVMGMLAAWSILNKVNNHTDERFADVVLIVCPNMTICDRLRPLSPQQAENSLYVTSDLVPPHLMSSLSQGRVITTTWHVFEKVKSDQLLIVDVLALRDAEQNILVMNAEAHHAYRYKREKATQSEISNLITFDDDVDHNDASAFLKGATIWMDGLDRIHKLKGIKLCLDFSATPYFLSGATNRPFPWLVSHFNLADAIESGLVKAPQLAEHAPAPSILYPIQRNGQAFIPGAINIWEWILPQLAPYEQHAGRAKPYAILKYAQRSLFLLGRLWEATEQHDASVFVIVCQNRAVAQVVYKWLAENEPPFGVPSSMLHSLRNDNDQLNTLWAEPALIHETDHGGGSDTSRFLRFTLDTVGLRCWPTNQQREPIYPTGFEELAKKLGKSKSPPGRDVRCVIVAGRLPEGWRCHTVTHLIGLRPFTSQLQCELVVGAALRRKSLDADDAERVSVVKVVGIPFEVVPFNASD